MPIYEYRCGSCGEFEVMQRITERPLTRCPTCRAKVTKLISNSSFQLKGSGWYVTDYGRKDSAGKGASKESKSDAKAESTSESSSSSSETKTSDTKTAETKTSKSKEAAAA